MIRPIHRGPPTTYFGAVGLLAHPSLPRPLGVWRPATCWLVAAPKPDPQVRLPPCLTWTHSSAIRQQRRSQGWPPPTGALGRLVDGSGSPSSMHPGASAGAPCTERLRIVLDN